MDTIEYTEGFLRMFEVTFSLDAAQITFNNSNSAGILLCSAIGLAKREFSSINSMSRNSGTIFFTQISKLPTVPFYPYFRRKYDTVLNYMK